MVQASRLLIHRADARLVVMLIVGVAGALITSSIGSWSYAPLVGWTAAAIAYTSWVWLAIGGMDAEATASHAVREDPSRQITELLVIGATVASLGAVALVLVEARQSDGLRQGTMAGLAVAGVVLSWLLVHTLFTLRYASLYYRDDADGIDFNQEEKPQYSDFAYIAFSVGMTFQVSDTDLKTHAMRASVLRHALLSYVFGSVILATTINLVVGLSG